LAWRENKIKEEEEGEKIRSFPINEQRNRGAFYKTLCISMCNIKPSIDHGVL
jgi:hypothetical protein